MKNSIVAIKATVLMMVFSVSAQGITNYEASADFPFGRPNPEAPIQILDYKYLIGISNCTSIKIKPDKTWSKPVKMTWTFKYIMNGMAVQDSTIKDDGIHSGSIRQYSKPLARWFVHYYSTSSVPVDRKSPTTFKVWEGNMKKDDIVLYREQKAADGTDGFSRLIFSEMTKKGFKWTGAWVDKQEKIVFPFWKISCTKQ